LANLILILFQRHLGSKGRFFPFNLPGFNFSPSFNGGIPFHGLVSLGWASGPKALMAFSGLLPKTPWFFSGSPVKAQANYFFQFYLGNSGFPRGHFTPRKFCLAVFLFGNTAIFQVFPKKGLSIIKGFLGFHIPFRGSAPGDSFFPKPAQLGGCFSTTLAPCDRLTRA